MTAKQQFINAYRQEHATTSRVLRAFPADRGDLRPHPKCRTARELAWIFVGEQNLCSVALTSGFDWTSPPLDHPAPATMEEVVAAFEAGRDELTALVWSRDDELSGSVRFPVAPRTLADIPLVQFLWMNLCDQIHHRGQFSIYLRMADGRVPSIYGPTADEPWV